MAALWFSVMLVLWPSLFTHTASANEAPLKIIFAQQSSNVTLNCSSTLPVVTRSWYSGAPNLLTYLKPGFGLQQKLLFIQAGGMNGGWNKVTNRTDVALEVEEFVLKILNVNQSTLVPLYTCVTNHSDGADFQTYRIQVYKPLADVQVVHLVEGEDVMLHCPSSSSMSGVSKAWSRGPTKDITPFVIYNQTAAGELHGTIPYVSNFTVDKTTFALAYTNTQFHDRGYYKCTVHITDAPETAIIFLNVYRAVEIIEVAEFSNIDLASGIPAGEWKATWEHARRGALFYGTPVVHLISQPRASMSLLGNSFGLRIAKVLLQDDTFISCVQSSSSSLIDSAFVHRLQVYIQPRVVGLLEIEFNDTDTVTMSCVIDRVYPRFAASDFRMTWGGVVKEPIVVANSDGSWSYNISFTKTLTMADDQTTVNCTTNPSRGTVASRVEVITVLGMKNPTADVTTRKSIVKRDDGSGGSGIQPANQPSTGGLGIAPIVGGAIGGLILLAIIVIIVVVVVRKRKRKDDNEKDIYTSSDYEMKQESNDNEVDIDTSSDYEMKEESNGAM